MAKNNSAETAVKTPKLEKVLEFESMLELVRAGMWRNVNLAKAVGVDRDTISDWKKRPEVQEVYRQTLIKFMKRRTDIEKVLNELDVETPPEPPKTLIQMYQPIFGGKSLNGLPADNSNQQDIQPEQEN